MLMRVLPGAKRLPPRSRQRPVTLLCYRFIHSEYS